MLISGNTATILEAVQEWAREMIPPARERSVPLRGNIKAVLDERFRPLQRATVFPYKNMFKLVEGKGFVERCHGPGASSLTGSRCCHVLHPRRRIESLFLSHMALATWTCRIIAFPTPVHLLHHLQGHISRCPRCRHRNLATSIEVVLSLHVNDCPVVANEASELNASKSGSCYTCRLSRGCRRTDSRLDPFFWQGHTAAGLHFLLTA